MRVTAGKYKNRRLQCPPGVIRPAMERMRVSLFSILGDLTGLSFLDVFSGSGIMCAEAASRGASRVSAVEKDFLKKRTITSNLSFIEEEKSIFIMDAFLFFRKFKGKDSYDVVYFDPPFPFKKKIEMLNMAYDNQFLNDNGRIVIHYPKEDEKRFEDMSPELEIADSRAYGRSMVKILRKKCPT